MLKAMTKKATLQKKTVQTHNLTHASEDNKMKNAYLHHSTSHESDPKDNNAAPPANVTHG